MAAASLLLDWYVFNGLKTWVADWKSIAFRRLVTFGYLVISIGISVTFVAGLSSFGNTRGMTPFHEWTLSFFLTFLITKIFFVLVLLLGDIGRFFYGIVNYFTKTKPVARQPFFPGRRKFISEAAILVAAFPFTSLLYGIFKGKYDYRVHRQTLHFSDLPEAFDGFTITQISDIHSGSFDNKAAVRRGIELARAQKSDLFVFTGDLVNNAAWEIEPYLADFAQLKSPYGQFSILGNHDYGDYVQWNSEAEKEANHNKLKEHHATLGYRLMLNENTVIEKGGQKIALIGVENWGRDFIKRGNLDEAIKGVDEKAFKILLSHDPTHWEDNVRYHPTTIHLTLAGHTHGAQFGVETAGFRWSPVQYKYLNWAGLCNEKDRYLYVNRGFGFLAFSGRVGIWPEVTVITLKKA